MLLDRERSVLFGVGQGCSNPSFVSVFINDLLKEVGLGIRLKCGVCLLHLIL